MFNALQCNCFNLVDTCNIALILFLKCDVTKFRIPPPPLVTQCDTSSTSSAPLNVDVIYGCPPRPNTCPEEEEDEEETVKFIYFKYRQVLKLRSSVFHLIYQFV